MFPTCFQIYYQPVYIYLKRAYELATDNHYALATFSGVLAAIVQALEKAFNVDVFGISNYLLMLVIVTVLIDARFGIKKSVKQSREAFAEAQKHPEGSPERKKFLKLHELKKFKPIKLQFTFFKCFTLLGYLYFVKHLLSSDSDDMLGQVLGFTSGVVLKAPLAIFWYYDFKSIGDNSAYVYGKKAPIFTIVQKIFEPKIGRLFKSENNESN